MTIFDNEQAVGFMAPEVLAEMQAWPHGHLRYDTHGRWVPWIPNWTPTSIYRAIPLPLTKPSVDWSILSDKIVGIARDGDGAIHAYGRKPNISRQEFVPNGGFCRRIDMVLPSVTPGTCDWRDSWVDNPRYKP